MQHFCFKRKNCLLVKIHLHVEFHIHFVSFQIFFETFNEIGEVYIEISSWPVTRFLDTIEYEL